VRLGLLADIHEAIELLTAAVRELDARRVEAFVVLGDVVQTGERITEVVACLSPLPGVGVWGNHDQGLCQEVHPSVRAQFPATVLDYFARLRPSVEIDGCWFQHVDPHLDPNEFADLWQFPSDQERIEGMAKCTHARVFVGHLHRWGLFTPQERIAWDGDTSIRYRAGERHLTTVHAVMDGWCAFLDTDREVLEPIRVTGN